MGHGETRWDAMERGGQQWDAMVLIQRSLKQHTYVRCVFANCGCGKGQKMKYMHARMSLLLQPLQNVSNRHYKCDRPENIPSVSATATTTAASAARCCCFLTSNGTEIWIVDAIDAVPFALDCGSSAARAVWRAAAGRGPDAAGAARMPVGGQR